jgi:hypothetical protein
MQSIQQKTLKPYLCCKHSSCDAAANLLLKQPFQILYLLVLQLLIQGLQLCVLLLCIPQGSQNLHIVDIAVKDCSDIGLHAVQMSRCDVFS